MTRHYIRLDNENNIIHGYSDEFENYQYGDICIREEGGRQFKLTVNGEDITNPDLFVQDIPLYYYNSGEIKKKNFDIVQEELIKISEEGGIMIPSNADMFYVSDAFSITVPVYAGSGNKHYPGTFNTDKYYNSGEVVNAYILSASLGMTPLNNNVIDGINVDIQIGMYDIDAGNTCVGIFKFASPYGNATNGLVLNHVCKSNVVPVSTRIFTKDYPLILTFNIPANEPTHRYKLGAVFTFFSGYDLAEICHYQYHVHGGSKKVEI
jgi:hypothetical protein